ncbi:MAG: right-handed parallel beta-helix repeat-containing protein [Anaerolineae bacterium]
MQPVSITVGPVGADIVGQDNRALQAAVDYVARLGGGTVRIAPGTYLMWDSLHLRSHVAVVGSGRDTILRKADAVSSALYLDGDYGEEQVTVCDASGFEPGMGITVSDERSNGFHVTVATIIARDGNTLAISAPLLSDYMVANGACAQTTFPVLSGYYLEGARVENLMVNGNRDGNPPLNGCRGAGIFLYRANACQIRDCLIYHYNGDGISFQQSSDTIVEGCECAWNAALGLHPGSGSQRPQIRQCWSHDNGRIGLFLCWRVRHGRFENNRLEHNGESGISIGHKDTDNIFVGNVAVGNGRYGIHFREESEPMAGHRNTFIDCQVLDNGTADDGAGVRIDGITHDITFRNCLIGNTRRDAGQQRYGISIGKQATNIVLENVRFQDNLLADVHDERESEAAIAHD